MVKYRDHPHFKEILQQLGRAPFITNPSLEARLLIEHSSAPNLQKNVERRLNGEPIAYIVGTKDFWKHTFKVNEHTLIPRPDSETLIEAVLKSFPDKKGPYRILDLGTGSGCLLLSLLDEYRNATGIGVDISLPALEVARENATALGLHRARFIRGDWWEGVEGKYDIIISNPPYIGYEEQPVMAPETLSYEPEKALFAEEYGLADYKKISSALAPHLTIGGAAFIELNALKAKEIEAIFMAHNFHTTFYNDIEQRPRCLRVTLKTAAP